jgi:transcriptional regulator with XRE-family HTH domain
MKSPIIDQLLQNIPVEQMVFHDLYMDLVLRINQILKDKQIGKKELAELLGKEPSEVSKWLNGQHNFTLKTIAKLSAVFNEPIIEISKKKISKKAQIPHQASTYKNFEQVRNLAEPTKP